MPRREAMLNSTRQFLLREINLKKKFKFIRLFVLKSHNNLNFESLEVMQC